MAIGYRKMLAWATTAVILALCLTPSDWIPAGPPSPGRISHADKLVHFSMFAAFGYCWAAATSGRLTVRRAASVFGAAVALAVGTELAQGLEVLHRDADPLDALADVVGAAFGIGMRAIVAPAPAQSPPDRAEA
jgi:hypothetical protein